MLENITLEYCVSITKSFSTAEGFQPIWVIQPTLVAWYLCFFILLYNEYKHNFKPVDVLELSALADRGLAISFISLENILPNEPWVCGLLQMLMLTFTWSYAADMIVCQVNLLLYVYLDSKYKKAVTMKTASKIAHFKFGIAHFKFGIVVMVIMTAISYDQYFSCDNLNIHFT